MIDKVKAYDEALENAKKLRDDCQKELDKTDKTSRLADLLRSGISTVELIFPQLRESEDETIRKEIYNFFKNFKETGTWKAIPDVSKWITYLEKQKYDRMQPIYDNQESFESALDKAWKSYNDCGSRTVDSCEDDYIECAHAKGFREGYLFGLEKQKEWEPIDLK